MLDWCACISDWGCRAWPTYLCPLCPSPLLCRCEQPLRRLLYPRTKPPVQLPLLPVPAAVQMAAQARSPGPRPGRCWLTWRAGSLAAPGNQWCTSTMTRRTHRCDPEWQVPEGSDAPGSYSSMQASGQTASKLWKLLTPKRGPSSLACACEEWPWPSKVRKETEKNTVPVPLCRFGCTGALPRERRSLRSEARSK